MALNFENANFDKLLDKDENVGEVTNSIDGSSLRSDALNSTMREAVQHNPDMEAANAKMAAEANAPLDVVEHDPEGIKAGLNFSNMDLGKLQTDRPKTAGFVSRYENAIIAHDDLEILGSLEQLFDTLSDGTFDNLGESITIGFESQFKGLQLRGADTAPTSITDLIPAEALPPGFELEAEELSREYAAAFGITTDEELVTARDEAIAGMMADLKELAERRADITPEDLNLFQEGVRAGVESLANMAPGLVLMAATGGNPVPLLTTIGVQTYGESYGAARKDGLDVAAAQWKASIDTAIEVGTELLPVGTLSRIISGKAKGNMTKAAMKFAVQEMGTEQLATIGQTLNDLAFGLDDQLANAETIPDMIAIQLRRQAITAIATVVAGGAQIGGVNTVRKAYEATVGKERVMEKRVEVEQNTLDNIELLATESLLKGRSEASFKQFIQELDGDQNTNVFIDGAQVSLYLQQKTPAEIEADPALRMLKDQMVEASRLGGDVVIPVAEFASTIATTEHFEQLRDSMTLSAETVAPFRQAEHKQETRQYLAGLLAEAEENVSLYVESQEIFDSVKQQLIDTGVYSAKVSNVMAQIVPAWATVFALKNNITIKEAYEQSGLIIEGPQTGKREDLEGQLAQEGVSDAGTRRTRDESGSLAPLEGAPTVKGATGPTEEIVQVKQKVAEETGLDTSPQVEYAKVDPERAARIAEAYDQMEHAPQDPVVQEAYQNMIDQTTVQYEALIAAGYTFYFFDETNDPYDGNPWNAMRDLRENKRMGVFATESGFGSGATELNVDDNPMLAETGIVWTFDGQEKRVLANDLFRAVHDAFGHGLEGAGFRAEGEENAWQAHIRMFTGSARGAVTSETRGQNSWLNYGPFGEKNRTAKVEDTTFADQKTGLMPEWTWTEGIVPSETSTFKQEGDEELRGFFDPANVVIRLQEAADLSTFLHEFAHFMLEMERNAGGDTIASINKWNKRNAEEVAKEAGELAPNTTIIAKHVIDFIDTGTAGDRERDDAIDTAIHEQFARGFEVYLMEGKAPSIELRNVFQTFARWLIEVWKRIRPGMKPNVDQAMTEVYDRLLATEEQIAAAEARARYEPMFTDATMAGMTEKQFEAYLKNQEEVQDVQAETLRDKLIAQFTRTQTKIWNADKKDIVNEELDNLANDQVYLTRNALKTGEVKLDLATVKRDYGVDRVDKLGGKSRVIPSELTGMTLGGGNGIHPDEAAAFFGYTSGAEMVEDLITAPKLKDEAERRADVKMKEIHGDALNDGTIERLADDAVQNEARGRLILKELKALSRGTNVPAIDRQTMKGLAEERIGKLNYKTLHPGKFRKAEIRAAQEAATKLAQGDREGAAQAKVRQAMNYYLGMAANQGRIDILKIVDHKARYNKKAVQAKIMKAGGEYWEQLVKILERFEFRKGATLKSVEAKNSAVRTWMENRIAEHGEGLILTEPVLNELFQTHWKEVELDVLKGIDDSVKNIEHVANYINKMDLLEEKVEFEKLASDWTTHMNQQKSVFTPQRTTTTEDRNWLRAGMAQMTKIPFMASWLDGGERVGMSHSILMDSLNVAGREEQELWQKTGEVVANAIADRSKEDQARHAKKIFIKEIKNEREDGNMMGSQILAVALNTGNAGNLRKMLLGESWVADPNDTAAININNPQLQAVLAHMTESDWKLVQLIWTQMESLYEPLAAVHRKTTGITPPQVVAVPVETPFGTLTGGYYPAVYDPSRSARAAENKDKADAQVESMFGGAMSIQAAINVGSTNERTGFYDAMNLNLDVVDSHFQETIHYITHHDAVRQLNKIINHHSVRETIIAKLGVEEYNQLKPWLNDIAKDGKAAPPKTVLDALFGRLRMGVTLGIMGFKASTGIIQVSGVFNTYAEVGSRHVHKAMRTIYGRGVSSITDASDFAQANSNIMSRRTKTMDREIKNALANLRNKRGFFTAAQEASMKHIAYIQYYTADLISWHAGYTAELERSGDLKKAYKHADWVVENVQGSGNAKDMATLFRNQSKIHTTFTMFMTFFSSLWNMERDLARQIKGRQISVSNTAAKMAFLFVLPVLFEMLMRGEIDPDDEALAQHMLTKTALFPLASIPFVRDAASGVATQFGYNSTPVASVLEKGILGIKGLATAALTDKEITFSQVKNATKLVAAAAKVPGVNQAFATGEHIYDVMVEGEELSAHQLLFGPKRD